MAYAKTDPDVRRSRLIGLLGDDNLGDLNG